MIFSEKSIDKNTDLIKVAALLIHAAKIDENYSDQEAFDIIDAIKKEIGKNGILVMFFGYFPCSNNDAYLA